MRRWSLVAGAVRIQAGPLLVVLMAAAAPATAQSVSSEWGLLEGRILTLSGAPLSGAVVRLDGPQARSIVSDAHGRFAFAALEPGEHAVEVGKAGYVTSLVERISLRSGEILYIGFELAPGKETSLTVTSMPVIDHTIASGSWRLDRRQLKLLPSAARLEGLLALRPQPSALALLDGSETGTWARPVEGEDLWRGLPTEFVAALAVTTTAPSPAQDFAGVAPVRLLTRPPQQHWHAGISSHWSGRGLAATERRGEGAPESGALESRWLRPVATGGGPILGRTRAWLGAASFRQRAEATESAAALSSSDRDYLQLRLDGQPLSRWRWKLLRLEGRSDPQTAAAGTIRQRQTQLQAVVLATPRLQLTARGLERQARRPASPFSAGEVVSRAWDLGLGWAHGGHRLLAGVAGERWEATLRSPASLFAGEPRRAALWVAERWRLGRVSLDLGVRLARRDFDRSPTAGEIAAPARERSNLLPRLALSWDPRGAGQWALFASAGRFDATAASASAAAIAGDEIERLALGVRHQLLPGVVIEAEVAQRKSRGGGDLLLSVPAPGEGQLEALCAGGERSGRLSTWARLGRRWDLAADYQLARARNRRRCAPPPLVPASGLLAADEGSRQGLRLWGTWRFENGVEAGAVLRQSQLEDPLATVTPSAERASTRLDLALGYGFGVLPAWARDGARMTLRLELINALDEETVATVADLPAGGLTTFGRLLRLEPRRLWVAVELRF